MKISHLAEIGYEILEINRANGWNVCTPADLLDDANQYKIPAVLALIASEITEFYQEASAGRPDLVHLAEELADVQIRTLDCAKPPIEAYRNGGTRWIRDHLAELFALTQGVAATFDGIDLDAAINEKLAKNRTRGHCHGGKKI